MQTARKIQLALSLLASFIFGSASALAPDQVFEKVSRSIVVVINIGNYGTPAAQGSGVVIGNEKVVTSCQVLKKGKAVEVKSGNARYGAKLLYADVARDLCMLEVKELNAPQAVQASLKETRIGQKVYVIGASSGTDLSLTDGLVSSIRTVEQDKMIQTTAQVPSGSNGGGLFDEQGRLIGITTLALRGDSQNLNLAVPVDYIGELPIRGKAVLAEDSKPVASKVPAPATTASVPAQPVFEERKLTVGEIKQHLALNPTINLKTVSGASISLQFTAMGIYAKQANPELYAEKKTGRLRFGRNNKMCLDLKPELGSGYDAGWFEIYGCLEVFQTGATTFTWKDKGQVMATYLASVGEVRPN